jgi:hypothetical protein
MLTRFDFVERGMVASKEVRQSCLALAVRPASNTCLRERNIILLVPRQQFYFCQCGRWTENVLHRINCIAFCAPRKRGITGLIFVWIRKFWWKSVVASFEEDSLDTNWEKERLDAKNIHITVVFWGGGELLQREITDFRLRIHTIEFNIYIVWWQQERIT